jgi:preprotein translocase subunit SecD
VAARVREGVPSAAVAISVETHGVQVIVHDRSKLRDVQDVLESTNAERRGAFTVSHILPGRFSIDLSNAGRKNAIRSVQSAMFETVRRGLRELGIANASVRLQGDDGLHADLPGYTDLGALQKKFGAPPSLICMPVVAVSEADLRARRHPDGTNLYRRRPTAADPHPAPVATYFDEAFSTADVREVRVEADPRGRPAVSIHLDNAGRDALANAERSYPHSPMAIILGDVAVSTPIARRMPLFDGVKIVGLTQAEADELASELSAATAIPPYTIYSLYETYGARAL